MGDNLQNVAGDRVAVNCVGIAEEAMDQVHFVTLEEVSAQEQLTPE